MSKQRIIKDEMWDDEWFFDLDPIEKLVWIFLLTNNRCNIAGVYKLNQKWAARIVGLDSELLPKIINRFVENKKIYLDSEWVVIINFTKHQAENPSVKQGICRVLESVPRDVLDRLSQSVPDCPTLLYFTLLNLSERVSEETQPFSTKKEASTFTPKAGVVTTTDYDVVPTNEDGDEVSPRKRPQTWDVEKRVFQAFAEKAKVYTGVEPEPAKLWQLKQIRQVLPNFTKQELLDLFDDWFNEASDDKILSIHAALSAHNLNKYKMKK